MALDLVPVLSFIWIRGKCRYCGARIPRRLLLVEVVTAALFTSVYLRYGFGADFAILCAAISLLLALAVTDLEHGLVLDRLLAPGIVAALILMPFWPVLDLPRPLLGSHSVLASVLSSLLAGGAAFLLFLGILLAYPRAMGRGDVKLAGLVGVLVGFPGVLIALWLAVVSGGSVAGAFLLLRKKGIKDRVPVAPYLAAGATVTLLVGDDIASWYLELVPNLGALWP